MTERIILNIEPHEDGKQCGECKGLDLDENPQSCALSDERLWLEGDPRYGDVQLEIIRGPLCLAAAAKYRAMKKAGQRLATENDEWTIIDSGLVGAWDRAVEEAEK